jgi:hypothetical protein
VSFAWQGGEPTLLGISFFERALELQKKYAGGKIIDNAFQTNGTLLDDAWGGFLARNKFLIGLSVDGPEEIHDAYRVDKGGQPTFARVMRGLGILKKHGVEFNTLTVINRKNAYRAHDVYGFLKQIGSAYLQFIPVVEQMAVQPDPNGLVLLKPYARQESSVSNSASFSPPSSMSGLSAMSAVSLCRSSMLRWSHGPAFHRAFASLRRNAARRWLWSTMATSTHATTLSIPRTSSATLWKERCRPW